MRYRWGLPRLMADSELSARLYPFLLYPPQPLLLLCGPSFISIQMKLNHINIKERKHFFFLAFTVTFLTQNPSDISPAQDSGLWPVFALCCTDSMKPHEGSTSPESQLLCLGGEHARNQPRYILLGPPKWGATPLTPWHNPLR